MPPPEEIKMTTRLQEAFAAVEKLPPDEQDVLASRLLAEVAEEDDFDQTIARTAHKLTGMANAALAEHRAGLTRDFVEQP